MMATKPKTRFGGRRGLEGRLGRCYELSGRYVHKHADAILVNGRVRWSADEPAHAGSGYEMEHAWDGPGAWPLMTPRNARRCRSVDDFDLPAELRDMATSGG